MALWVILRIHTDLKNVLLEKVKTIDSICKKSQKVKHFFTLLLGACDLYDY